MQFSFDHDPDAKPSSQLRALAEIYRLDDQVDLNQLEWITKLTFNELCDRIDSEFCEPKSFVLSLFT
jgi:hypothetical protein